MRKRSLFLLFLALILAVTAVIGLLNRQTKPRFIEPNITLYRAASDKVIKMDLEEYITGTVAAEMPASFGDEALKAQAVCARTYAVRKILEKHTYPKGAQLSDDITTCQAFIAKEEFQRRNPRSFQELWAKIAMAVKETRGEVMFYDGEPVDALYHSTCGGRTESSESIPYLRSVTCTYCQASTHYRTSQTIPAQAIRECLAVTGPIRVSIIQRTPGGRAAKLDINGSTFYAETLRRAFNLPSTWWSLSSQNGNLIVECRGYGHGLGMCQYGAGGMAAQGYSYDQILAHYYQGIERLRLDY